MRSDVLGGPDLAVGAAVEMEVQARLLHDELVASPRDEVPARVQIGVVEVSSGTEAGDNLDRLVLPDLGDQQAWSWRRMGRAGRDERDVEA